MPFLAVRRAPALLLLLSLSHQPLLPQSPLATPAGHVGTRRTGRTKAANRRRRQLLQGAHTNDPAATSADATKPNDSLLAQMGNLEQIKASGKQPGVEHTCWWSTGCCKLHRLSQLARARAPACPCISLIPSPLFPPCSCMGHSQNRSNNSGHRLRHRHGCARLRAWHHDDSPASRHCCPPPPCGATGHGNLRARSAPGQRPTCLPAPRGTPCLQASTPPTLTSSQTS